MNVARLPLDSAEPPPSPLAGGHAVAITSAPAVSSPAIISCPVPPLRRPAGVVLLVALLTAGFLFRGAGSDPTDSAAPSSGGSPYTTTAQRTVRHVDAGVGPQTSSGILDRDAASSEAMHSAAIVNGKRRAVPCAGNDSIVVVDDGFLRTPPRPRRRLVLLTFAHKVGVLESYSFGPCDFLVSAALQGFTELWVLGVGSARRAKMSGALFAKIVVAVLEKESANRGRRTTGSAGSSTNELGEANNSSGPRPDLLQPWDLLLFADFFDIVFLGSRDRHIAAYDLLTSPWYSAPSLQSDVAAEPQATRPVSADPPGNGHRLLPHKWPRVRQRFEAADDQTIVFQGDRTSFCPDTAIYDAAEHRRLQRWPILTRRRTQKGPPLDHRRVRHDSMWLSTVSSATSQVTTVRDGLRRGLLWPYPNSGLFMGTAAAIQRKLPELMPENSGIDQGWVCHRSARLGYIDDGRVVVDARGALSLNMNTGYISDRREAQLAKGKQQQQQSHAKKHMSNPLDGGADSKSPPIQAVKEKEDEGTTAPLFPTVLFDHPPTCHLTTWTKQTSTGKTVSRSSLNCPEEKLTAERWNRSTTAFRFPLSAATEGVGCAGEKAEQEEGLSNGRRPPSAAPPPDGGGREQPPVDKTDLLDRWMRERPLSVHFSGPAKALFLPTLRALRGIYEPSWPVVTSVLRVSEERARQKWLRSRRRVAAEALLSLRVVFFSVSGKRLPDAPPTASSWREQCLKDGFASFL